MKESNFPGELVYFSAITGAIAAFIKSLIHHAFELVGIASDLYDLLTAYLIHGHHRVKGFSEWFFSVSGDMALGALFGIVLGVWIKSSRSRYHWGIGLGFGFGIWFSSLAFGNLTKLIEKDMTRPMSLFAHLIAMIAYGMLFVLASRFWKPLRSRIEIDNRYD